MSDSNKKYFAFISYSHRDKKWADWLHKSLETFKVPKAIVGSEGRDGTVPKRVFPIFRDREELPTSADLGANINNALENSNYLVVICSPNSAKSQWVNEEILSWKRLGKENKILCLIVDGEPNATDMGQPDDECFPEALKFKLGDNLELTTERTEPIAADAREHADGKSNAKLKLLAGLLGVNYDALKQREKRRQIRTRIMYAVLASTMSIIAVVYWQYAQNLNNEKLISESITLASASKEALAKGNSSKAILLALQALPDDINNAQRPYVAEAEAALSQAMYQHKELFSIQAHQGKITSSVFSPDNRLLITSGEDWKVKVWDMTTHKLIKELVEHKASIIRVVHHAEKNILISWDSEGQLIVWNTTDWSIKCRFNHYTIKYVKDIDFSVDGRYLIAGKLIWDIEKNSQVALDFDESLKKLDIDNLLSIKGTSKLIAQAKNHLLLLDLGSRTLIGQYEIPLVKGDHLGDMKSLIVLEGSGLLFLEFAYKNYLLNAKDLSINRKIKLNINRVLGYKVESQELICIIDNELQLWNLVTNQTQKLNDKNEKYYNTAKIKLLNSYKGVIAQDSNLINIIDLSSGSVTARYESGLAVGDIYTSDSVIRDISTNKNESLMSMALIDGRVKIFDLSLLKHQVSHKLGSKIKRFKKSLNKSWLAIYLENKDLILVDIENQNLKTISTNVEINDFDFALSDRKIIMLLDTKAISLDVVDTADTKVLYPFNDRLELAKDFELSRSRNTLTFTSTNSQLASYDLKNNKWLKQSNVTGIQGVSNLGTNWVVKTSGSSMSHFNSTFSKDSVQVLPSTALNSLYYTQYKVSGDTTKAVWLDNDGYVVYWDTVKKSQIFSIKLSKINNSIVR